MNLHPGSESFWTFRAQIQSLTSPCALASRKWVTLDIQSSNSIADMLLWPCIQTVSHHGHSELKFNYWHAPLNLHPGSESPWTFTAQIQLLTCSYELGSSQWVIMDIQSSNSITDMPLWTCIQEVSHPGHSELKFNCWHALVNLHPGSESPWTFRAQIQLLICSHELRLESESPWTFRAQIQLLICSCEHASSMWVIMTIHSSNSITDMLLWTCIQRVSHPGHRD